jgi:hypothetical protein
LTIVNLALSPTRGLIATDSLTFSEETTLYRPDGSPAEETKMVALPIQRLVITMLGSQALRQHLAVNAHLLPNVDEAIRVIPQLLRDAWPTHRMRRHAGRRYSDGSTAVIMGWSDSNGRVIGAEFSSANDFKARTLGTNSNGTSWRIDPAISTCTGLSLSHDAPGMLELVRRQLAEWRAKDAAVPLGGRLCYCELTERGITMTLAEDLGLPAPRASEAKRLVDAATPIESVQIAAEAATVTDYDTSASGNFNANGIDGYDIVVSTTINELTWANDTGDTVEVQLDHAVKGTKSTTSGAGSCWYTFEWEISSGGGAAAEASSLLQTDERDFSHLQQVSVPDGRTITARLTARVVINSGTQVRNNWRLANSRLSAIKR